MRHLSRVGEEMTTHSEDLPYRHFMHDAVIF